MYENLNIIMVEDDEGHAKLIEKNLRRAGISNEITHFTDGGGILNHFFNGEKNRDFSKVLILLDLNLPKVDGYGVLEKIKSDPTTKKIPVIILTTTDNPKEIEKCYDLGCNVYITKPVEYNSFSEAIRKLGLMLSIVKIPTPSN